MPPRGTERRQHPRITRRIDLTAPVPPGSALSSPSRRSRSGLPVGMQTLDISAGGANCLSPVPLRLMTRLEISLFLPAPDGRAAQMVEPLVVQGCVVRCQPAMGAEGGGMFRLAILFTDIDENDRDLIERCVSARPQLSPLAD